MPPVPFEETLQLVVSEVILFVFSKCLCLPLGTLCKTLLLLLKGLSDSRAQQPGGQPAGEASDPVELGRASRLTALLGWLREPASPLSKVLIEVAHSCGIFWVSASQHFASERRPAGNFLNGPPGSCALRGSAALTSGLLLLRPPCL